MHHHPEEHDENADDFADSRISKTRRKNEMNALQDLGVELVKLSRERLEKMDLPERLLTELLEAQRLKANGAIRRQMQFIGKLMRDVDAEPIIEHLAVIRGESNTAKAEFHALEQWRERLLEHDAALTEWLARHPDADAQQMRQLIRNARKEASEGRPPKSSRLLFKLLRDSTP
ncbi:MAG: ribosome biogenesis factor YjgA [Gallionellaceae bacterium]|nr:ribosome biogenesis factor YjgA [Gallionellaceae bacterium]